MRSVLQGGTAGRRLRLLLGVAVLLAATVLVAVPQPMRAGGTAFVCDYYSDASFTAQVGERTRDCAGNRTSWGVTSAFVDCITDACCGNNYC